MDLLPSIWKDLVDHQGNILFAQIYQTKHSVDSLDVQSTVVTNSNHSSSFIIIVGCRLYGFFGTMASLAEIWSLSFVSLDRLRSIYYPLQNHMQIKSSQVSEQQTGHPCHICLQKYCSQSAVSDSSEVRF